MASVGWSTTGENNTRQHGSSLDTAEKENTIEIFPFVETQRDQLRACALVQWLGTSNGQILSGSKGGKDEEGGLEAGSPSPKLCIIPHL